MMVDFEILSPPFLSTFLAILMASNTNVHAKTQILIIRIERSPVFSIQVYRHLRIWMYLVINTRCKQLPLLKSFLKVSLLWFPHSEIHITILTISPNRNTEAVPDFYIPIQPLILEILLPMYFSKLFISLDLILTTPTKDSVYLT